MSGGFPLNKWWTLQAALTDCELSTRAKLTFARLLYYHNTKSGACFPSLPRLAHDLDCTDRSIRTALRALEVANYMNTQRGQGRNRTNQYDINVLSGKKAYEDREKNRRYDRKTSSPKQMNQNLKEQFPGNPDIPQGCLSHADEQSVEPSIAKKQGCVQRELAERLGAGAKGWGILFNIDDAYRESVELRVIAGAISIEQGVQELIDFFE